MTAKVLAAGYGVKPEDVFLNESNSQGHVSFRPAYPTSLLSPFRHYTVSLSVSYPSRAILQSLIVENTGSVRAQLTNLTASGSYIVSGANGKVEVALPSTAQFRLTARSADNVVGIEDFTQCGLQFTRTGPPNVLTATCGNGSADVELSSQTGQVIVDNDFLSPP